jgi:8-oxo-dGTP diphosphatase
MRVISVAYFALVAAEVLTQAIASITSSADEPLSLAALRVPWEGEAGGDVQLVDESGAQLELAFDHARMLGMAVKRLRGRLDYSPIAFELLGKEFTLRMLQDIHEAILGRALNKDAFRRRLLATGTLVPTGRLETCVDHRPAELYRFRPQHSKK